MFNSNRSYGAAGLLLAVVLCICAVAAPLASQICAKDTAPEEAIAAQLACFSDSDAVYTGQVSVPYADAEYASYHSNLTDRDYYFDSIGVLIEVNSCISDADYDRASQRPAMAEAQLDAAMKEFAEQCIALYQIGQMEMTARNAFAGHCNYVFTETYEQMQTGSQVALECMQDGTVVYAVITKGSVFAPTGQQTVVRKAPIKVTADEAYLAAVSAVEGKIAGTDYALLDAPSSCALEALGNDQFYKVELAAYSEKEQYTVTYWVNVNVTDGSIMKIEFTQ